MTSRPTAVSSNPYKRFLGRLTCLLAVLCSLAPIMANAVVRHAPAGRSFRAYGAIIQDAHTFAEDADILTVDIIDIGAGDAILLRSGGQSMLVDGGIAGRAKILQQFFERNGVESLDYFFNTHAHGDHIQAQRRLMSQGVLPGSFLSALPRAYGTQEQRDTVAVLEQHGVPYRRMRNLEELNLGNTVLTFFYDDRPSDKIVPNNRSMLIHIAHGERTLLLTADTAGNSLLYLTGAHPHLVNTDIMKSPHHGLNRLHAEVLERVNPSVVVITNSQIGGDKLAGQLRWRKVPHYFVTAGTVRLQTDGSHWFVRQKPKVQ